jgi:hypothetical protein
MFMIACSSILLLTTSCCLLLLAVPLFHLCSNTTLVLNLSGGREGERRREAGSKREGIGFCFWWEREREICIGFCFVFSSLLSSFVFPVIVLSVHYYYMQGMVG